MACLEGFAHAERPLERAATAWHTTPRLTVSHACSLSLREPAAMTSCPLMVMVMTAVWSWKQWSQEHLGRIGHLLLSEEIPKEWH